MQISHNLNIVGQKPSHNYYATHNHPFLPRRNQAASHISQHRLSAPTPFKHVVKAGGGFESSNNISAKEANGLRRIGWISFWSQLALSIVSSVVLFFTANTAAKGNFPQLPVIFNVGGVAAGFISTFLAFTKTRIARNTLESGKQYSKSKVANDILNATRLNLIGMGATVVALQSTVGGLVGKALTSSSTTAYNVQAAQNAPAALDVFAVQASTNTILLHFLAILFSNWTLRILNQSTRASAT